MKLGEQLRCKMLYRNIEGSFISFASHVFQWPVWKFCHLNQVKYTETITDFILVSHD